MRVCYVVHTSRRAHRFMFVYSERDHVFVYPYPHVALDVVHDVAETGRGRGKKRRM